MRVFLKYLILLAFFDCQAFAGTASVEAIGGANAISVQRKGKEVKLKVGDMLQLEDLIVTDKLTAVDIRLEDQTILRLGVNSSYKITEDGKTKKLLHRFLSGIVRVLVPAKKEGPAGDIKFRMSTAEGTIGVRGTEFVVVKNTNETVLKGLTGEVLFGPPEQDFSKLSSFVIVTKGFESAIKKGARAPSKPKEYSLQNYLNDLSKRENNSFGLLAARTSGEVKLRGSEKTTVSSFSAPVVQKPKALNISSGETKKQEEKEEIDIEEELLLAIVKGDLDRAMFVVKELKAGVNVKDEQGNTPLHAAAVHNRLSIMQNVLIANGAEVNAKNKKGHTPLMLVALESGETETAMVLVQAQAKLNEKDGRGRTALDIAKEQGYKKLAEYLEEISKLQ